MPQRVGKVTEWTVLDNPKAPIICKVGGEKLKHWKTQTIDGMEVETEVHKVLSAALTSGVPVLVTVEEEKGGYETKRAFGPYKVGDWIDTREAMATAATTDIPEGATHVFDLDKKGNPIVAGVTTANTLNGHSNGKVPTQEFTGREPGTYDRMFLFSECIRHAILAAEEGGPFSEMPVLDRAKFFFDAVQDSVKSAETKAAEQVAEAF